MKNSKQSTHFLILMLLLVLINIPSAGALEVEEPAAKTEQPETVVIQNPNPPDKTEEKDGEREVPSDFDFSTFKSPTGILSCDCLSCECIIAADCEQACSACFGMACWR